MKALVAAAVLAGAAMAQQTAPIDEAAMTAAWKAQDEGRLLDADTVLRARAFDAAGRPIPGDAYEQLAQFHSMLTNVAPPTLAMPGEPVDATDPADLARIARATPHDAVAAIVRRARSTRIVILNEDHASPRDRAFALEVAHALRPLGYTLLGAETFNNQPDRAMAAAAMERLARDGYPRRGTGVYTNDPVFGDFVRQSLALGYRPFAYEETAFDPSGSWKARIARREQAQADDIARVLTADRTAKLFVYVGFGHAREQPKPDREGGGEPDRLMALRLKAMTGIDPLTIDQTVLNDSGSGDRALHARIASKLGDRPAVLFDGDRPLVLGPYRGAVDLQVAHPPLRRVHGRPDWLARMGRHPVAIPPALLPKTGTHLVKAFVAAEAADAVPVDMVLVTAGTPAPMLMLPDAPVRYAVEDAAR